MRVITFGGTPDARANRGMGQIETDIGSAPRSKIFDHALYVSPGHYSVIDLRFPISNFFYIA